MSKKLENINYTYTDIERYLQGKMSNEEMHSLEVAALQDPFLADAIEGFGSAENVSVGKDLSDIKKQLLGNQGKAKVVSLKSKSTFPFIKAAAAVIGFAFVAFIGYTLLKKPSSKDVDNELAKIEISNNSETINSSKKEIIPLNKTSDSNLQTIDKEKANNYVSQNSAKSFSANSVANDDIQSNIKGTVSIQSDTILPSFRADANNSFTYAWAERKDSSVNKPNAEIAANTNNGFYNNSSNNISNYAYKPSKPRRGFSNETAANTINTSNSIIQLAPVKLKTDTSFKPVAYTNIGEAKKALSNSEKQTLIKLSKEDSLVIPENGWTAFYDYIKQNNTARVSITDTSKSDFITINKRTGEEVVDLEFLVDKDGAVSNVIVKNSTNAVNDSTAISLLKNGPKWIATDAKKNDKAKEKKGKVSIKF